MASLDLRRIKRILLLAMSKGKIIRGTTRKRRFEEDYFLFLTKAPAIPIPNKISVDGSGTAGSFAGC